MRLALAILLLSGTAHAATSHGEPLVLHFYATIIPQEQLAVTTYAGWAVARHNGGPAIVTEYGPGDRVYFDATGPALVAVREYAPVMMASAEVLR